MRVLAVAQRFAQRAGDDHPVRQLVAALRRIPRCDRSIVRRGAGEGLGRKPVAQRTRHAALAQRRLQGGIVERIGHDRDPCGVLRGGADHGRPADVDVLDRRRGVGAARNRRLERIEVHDQAIDALECRARSSAARCSGSSRSASSPPWMRGCSVFTRPSIISGKPVTALTSVTARPASASVLAVPPVERISTPCAASARASVDDARLVGDREQRALDRKQLRAGNQFGCRQGVLRIRGRATAATSPDCRRRRRSASTIWCVGRLPKMSERWTLSSMPTSQFASKRQVVPSARRRSQAVRSVRRLDRDRIVQVKAYGESEVRRRSPCR